MEMEKEVKILNLDEILPNRFQPRIKFNESAILELSESIKEHGVIQPIVVRKISDKYEIIAGERRYKASILAGKTSIPAIITTLDDKDSAEIALIENVQRQDLTPIEEAISYKKILDMGYLNQSDLADKLGKTQSTVANKLRLLNLDEDVQEALLENKISERHARSLLKLNKDDQKTLLNKIISERLTVRKTDDEISKILNQEPKERKEENQMNKEFNIPTGDIIEPQTSQPVTPNNLWDMPTAETPQPDFSSLFNTNMAQPVVETPVIQPEPVQAEQPVMPTFNFNSFNVGQDDNLTQGLNEINSVESKFNEISTPVESISTAPVAPVEPVSVEPATFNYEQPQSQGKFFDMFNGQQPVAEMPVEQPVVEEVQPQVTESVQTPVEPVPVENPFNFDFTSFGNTSSTPVTEEPKQPEVFNQNYFDSIQPTQPVEQSVVPVEPVIPTPIVEEVQPQVTEPVQPVMTNPEVSFNQFTPYSLDDSEEFTQPSEYENNQFGTVVTPQSMEESQTSKADLRVIIKTIRDCASTIESMGYTLDLDELDFADSYQVTFKINK